MLESQSCLFFHTLLKKTELDDSWLNQSVGTYCVFTQVNNLIDTQTLLDNGHQIPLRFGRKTFTREKSSHHT